MKSNPDFHSIIDKFIADASASIRQFARYYLKITILDFAMIYHQNLINNKRTNYRLIGWFSRDQRSKLNTVIRFLNDPKVKVRKAAFLALTKLDEKAAYNYGLTNLDVDIPGIRNAIVDFLTKFSNEEVLTKSRGHFKTGNKEVNFYFR